MSFPPGTNPRPDEPVEEIDSIPLPERRTRPVPLTFTAGEPVIDAWPTAEVPAQGEAWRKARRFGWELVQTLVLAALIFFAVRAMAQNFRVEGSSMEPGLHDGQYLLVNKAVYAKINLETLSKFLPFIDPGDHPQRFIFQAPKRGDVVVFRFPNDPSRDFIKRVIAVPGDSIEIKVEDVVINGESRRISRVYVNDIAIDEPYVKNHGTYEYERTFVPAGHYFVLGDNRSNSYDSHVWNFLPEDHIIGKAMLSYWPLENFGRVGNTTINLGIVKVPLLVPW
jgi:signal peptidase I